MMKKKNILPRRKFVKSSVLASGACIGAATIAGCESADNNRILPIRTFQSAGNQNFAGIKGLLFSQLGYEIGLPVRIIIRLPEKDMVGAAATCILTSSSGKTISTPCQYWGSIWDAHWWIAEFDKIQEEDTWSIHVMDSGKTMYTDEGLKTAHRTLWNQTAVLSSVDMLERRAHFTKVGAGWQDAGALWVESPAQSGMIICLEDRGEKSTERFDLTYFERLEKQITGGCD
jgi:hypothetical protein